MMTVTKPDVEEVFDFLNLMVFEPEGFKVPMADHLDIMELEGYLGITLRSVNPLAGVDFVMCILNDEFKDHFEFVEIVAHEMIHIYQQKVLKTWGDHDDFFWSFKSIFGKYDLPLRERE